MNRYIDFAISKPKTFIAIFVIVTSIFFVGIAKLKVDTDILQDLPDNLPAKKIYDHVAKRFPSKEMIYILVATKEITKPEVLNTVFDLTKTLEELPVVQSVLSPTNFKQITLENDFLKFQALMDHKIKTESEAIKIIKILESDDMSKNVLIAREHKGFGLLVFFKTGVMETKGFAQIVPILNKFRKNFEIYAAGRPVATYYSGKIMGKDMGMLTTLALVIIILILSFTFRSFRGVLLPLGVTVSAIIWTLGLMGFISVPITHSTQAMPILLMAMGVADGIHILKYYYIIKDGFNDSKTLVREVMANLKNPVIMTSVTTMAGFLGLNTARIKSIGFLGFFTSFGILVAMFFSLGFIPAVLTLLKIPKKRKESVNTAAKDGFMVKYSRFLTTHRTFVIVFILSVMAVSVYGFTKINVEFDPIKNFKKDHPVRIADNFINRYLSGTTNFMFVVNTEKSDGAKSTTILKALSRVEEKVLTLPHVKKVQSIISFIKKINMIMHDNKKEYYRIPNEKEKEKGVFVEVKNGKEEIVEKEFYVSGRKIIAQYFLSMESQGASIDNFVDSNYQTLRTTFFLDTTSSNTLKNIRNEIKKIEHNEFSGLKVKGVITGMAALMLAINDLMVVGQGTSILFSLFLVFIITGLMFRSVKFGLLNTVPLFFSLFLNFGIMSAIGINLNVMTMAVSSIAIGVGVDYAIHFIHRFVEIKREGIPYEDTLEKTLTTSGIAIFINAITVASGFAALMLSSFTGIVEMGFLISLTMLTSAFAAITILPVIFKKVKVEKKQNKEVHYD